MLYPVTNVRRTAICLNGLWNFRPVADNYLPARRLAAPLLIGVPSSYNEIFPDASIRDHVGKVCYETAVAIPAAFRAMDTRLRLGAAGNRAAVYLDGEPIGEHNGGFLPIDLDIPPRFVKKGSVRLSVVLDNRLDFATLPIGEVEEKDGKRIQKSNHDFANETGIHRDVLLYSVPKNGIGDICVKTSGHDTIATVSYEVATAAEDVTVAVIAPDGTAVAAVTGKKNTLNVSNPVLWGLGRGNLYTLSVKTADDAYDLPFGIRDVAVKDGQFLLNGKPVFFKGFGMHEDHSTVGKGSVAALNARDFALLEWIGANSFRTSHYPYAEQMYELADRYGILVIDEVPAVGLNYWSARTVFAEGTVDGRTLAIHKQMLTEMIDRDRNHPAVVMISVANEANTYEAGAAPYFEAVFKHARTLTDLPVMIVENVGAATNGVAQYADVIGLNRYAGWYVDLAELDLVPARLAKELIEYHEKFHKPVLLTEFGADTVAGLHKLPAAAFSEEFQVDFIKTYHETVKTLPFVIGEHVWNFADFMTKQGITRVDGNKKGVFTRDRQPKMAAHYLKEAWKAE